LKYNYFDVSVENKYSLKSIKNKAWQIIRTWSFSHHIYIYMVSNLVIIKKWTLGIMRQLAYFHLLFIVCFYIVISP